jgi:peptidoglycan/xylan/chitin deacetylase (PgdA/CDA1 family)
MSRWRRQPCGIVLTYHSISRRISDPYGLAVSPDAFEEQLNILRRLTRVLPATTIVEGLQAGSSLAGLSAVTFDDGYADALHIALPILERLQVPMTLFVTTSPVRDSQPFWWDRLSAHVLGRGPSSRDVSRELADAHTRLKQLTGSQRNQVFVSEYGGATRSPSPDLDRALAPGELTQLAQHPLIEIGAHTTSHPSLAALAEEDQRAELVESRAWLESHLSTPVRLLAYPFGKEGDVSEMTRATARAAGYRAAFMTTPVPLTPAVDVMAIPRLTVHQWTAREFERRVRELVGS